MTEIKVAADTGNLDSVLDFINEQLEAIGCPMKVQVQLNIAVEEIFVNIAHYAYPRKDGFAVIRFEESSDPKAVSITFTDRGTPYDPLKKPDPDITLSAEEREIGGLGIFMVKKSMDDVFYEYKDGCNIFGIRKVL